VSTEVACSAGRTYYVIYPSGVVSRCWARQPTVLGSVTDLELKEIEDTGCVDPNCRPCDFSCCHVSDGNASLSGYMTKVGQTIFRIMPTFKCNYSCRYCVVYEDPTEMDVSEANQKTISGDAWERWWEWIGQKLQDVRVCVSGGEPTSYSGFARLALAIDRLPCTSRHILFSNLSFPGRLAAFIDGRVKNFTIDATAHWTNPRFNIDRFCQTVKELRSGPNSVLVKIVAHGDYRPVLNQLKTRLGKVVVMVNKQGFSTKVAQTYLINALRAEAMPYLRWIPFG